jgi:uncharacterized repeat protein (TIGR01451 family)
MMKQAVTQVAAALLGAWNRHMVGWSPFMNFAVSKRIIILAAVAALLLPAIVLGGSAVPSHAGPPLSLTGTPLPEPTTPVPPTATSPVIAPTTTPVPGVTPSPTTEFTVPQPNRPLPDPFITLTGCGICMTRGEVTELTVVVGNNGGTSAFNVQVLNAVPEYLELIEMAPSRGTVTQASGAPAVDIGRVDPGERVTIKIRVRLKRDAVQGEALYAVRLLTTSVGNDPLNDDALAVCAVCQVALPVTGSDRGLSDQIMALLLTVMGIVLMSAAASRRLHAPRTMWLVARTRSAARAIWRRTRR